MTELTDKESWTHAGWHHNSRGGELELANVGNAVGVRDATRGLDAQVGLAHGRIPAEAFG